MKIKFRGKEYTLAAAGLADMVAFERHFGVPSSVLADLTVARIEWICFLAWRGLNRLKVEGAEAFTDALLEDLEFDGEDDTEVTTTEDPTVQEALAS